MGKPKQQLLTQSEYARRISRTPQHVHDLIKRGVIQLRNKKVDPEQADKAIRERTNQARSRRGQKSPEFFKSQADKEALRVRMLELDLKEREGELLPKHTVEKTFFEEGRRIRDRVLAINDRMAAFLNEEQSKILAKEIHVVMGGKK